MKTILGQKREAERVLAEIAVSNPELTEKLAVVREIVSYSAIEAEFDLAVQAQVDQCVAAQNGEALNDLAYRLNRRIEWDPYGVRLVKP